VPTVVLRVVRYVALGTGIVPVSPGGRMDHGRTGGRPAGRRTGAMNGCPLSVDGTVVLIHPVSKTDHLRHENVGSFMFPTKMDFYSAKREQL
jgi:hypothetical protein